MKIEHQVKIDSLPEITIEQKDSAPVSEREKIFEYYLKVEEHADKFFEMKHKITFFLTTAAGASVAYTLSFAIGRLAEVTVFTERKICLIIAAIGAFVSITFALLSMYYDVHLNRLNIGTYFKRKLYDELTPQLKDTWTITHRRAKDCEILAFTFLGISIAYQATFFVLFII